MATVVEVPQRLITNEGRDERKGLRELVDQGLSASIDATEAIANRLLYACRVLIEFPVEFQDSSDFRSYYLHRMEVIHPQESKRPAVTLDYLNRTHGWHATTYTPERGSWVLKLFVDGVISEATMRWLGADKFAVSAGGVTWVVQNGEGAPMLRHDVLYDVIMAEGGLLEQARSAAGKGQPILSQKVITGAFVDIAKKQSGGIEAATALAWRKQVIRAIMALVTEEKEPANAPALKKAVWERLAEIAAAFQRRLIGPEEEFLLPGTATAVDLLNNMVDVSEGNVPDTCSRADLTKMAKVAQAILENVQKHLESTTGEKADEVMEEIPAELVKAK